MNILLLGSGGREHAMAWKIAQSKLLSKLFIAPGNSGTMLHGENVNIQVSDFKSIKDFCLSNKVEMLVVGPEEPLVKGIFDFFQNDPLLKNIPVIGPSMEGAKLEGSKDFAKQFMQKYNIPTAKYRTFTQENIEEGYRFLEELKAPYVLKADGLAAGKGVLILKSLDEAKVSLKEMLGGQFGDAGKRVVIEEFLDGIEVSVFVLTDGHSYKVLPEAKDYKRIGDNDSGPNTGGMGAVSPVPFVNAEFRNKVEDRIIRPTVKGLLNEGIHYCGFIFIGLMNVGGEPYVIEYNVRMGDPETEAVFPRIKSDVVELFNSVGSKRLEDTNYETDERTVVTVMMVSEGYPGDYEKGKTITGLNNVSESLVFHAGASFVNNEVLTSGGRVIAVSSYGSSISDAREKSYSNTEKINYNGKYYRKDIGLDLMK